MRNVAKNRFVRVEGVLRNFNQVKGENMIVVLKGRKIVAVHWLRCVDGNTPTTIFFTGFVCVKKLVVGFIVGIWLCAGGGGGGGGGGTGGG